MKEIISQKINDIEKEHGVKVLYACESGSRAWGFASPDSDYDVRFIFAAPLQQYLSIRDRRDVIELPVNEVLDISGWDLRKALQLFQKTNAPLYEWLQSPIVYRQSGTLLEELQMLMPAYFSGRAAAHHYLSMAFNTFENDLQGDRVRLKKYFYALRPLMACLWIISGKGVPPMEFAPLRVTVADSAVQAAIDELLVLKSGADEKTFIPPVPLLRQWIGDTLATCKAAAALLPAQTHSHAKLDRLFSKQLGYDF